jgi:predicted dehydrogenase
MGNRIAIIGAGPIVPFHLKAFSAADLKVIAIAASPNSKNVKLFAEKYKIQKYYLDPQALIDEGEWDGIVIACKPEFLLQYLESALKFNRPILIEKPVALSSDNLKEIGFDHPNVLVAYNRRFYPLIQNLKYEIENSSPLFANVEIPEKIDFNLNLEFSNPVVLNSVHMFDLVRYLFGSFNVIAMSHLARVATTLSLTANDKHLINMVINYNASANFSITIDSQPTRYVLRPLELLTEISGMEVIEPSENIPVRRYTPLVVRERITDENSKLFKPGFLGQAKEFSALLHGQPIKNGATLYDAYCAILMAEQIIKTQNDFI